MRADLRSRPVHPLFVFGLLVESCARLHHLLFGGRQGLIPGCGADELEMLEADLADGTITGNQLSRKSVQRYVSVLPAVFSWLCGTGQSG